MTMCGGGKAPAPAPPPPPDRGPATVTPVVGELPAGLAASRAAGAAGPGGGLGDTTKAPSTKSLLGQ